MDRLAVQQKLFEIISEIFGTPATDLKAETRLISNLGAESIDLVDLTFRIEKTFQITIPEGELFDDAAHSRDWTLAEVQAYVEQRRHNQPPAS